MYAIRSYYDTLLNGKFVNPTEFYLNDSSYMILEANSKMIIEDDSKLILETGSKLEIGDGASYNFV